MIIGKENNMMFYKNDQNTNINNNNNKIRKSIFDKVKLLIFIFFKK